MPAHSSESTLTLISFAVGWNMRDRGKLVLSVLSCLVLVVSGVRDVRASSERERLPVRLISHYVIVQGSLGGRPNCTLVLDTGVNPSILHSRTAQELNLATTPQTVRMLDREVQTTLTQLPSFALGPVHRTSVPVLVHDLSQIERNLGIRVDALIGLDLLGQSSFTVDYIGRYVDFGPVEKTASSAKLITAQPGPIVEAKIEGRSVRLLVDTGSPGLVLFFDPGSTEGDLPKGTLTETGGTSRSRQILVKRTKVGNFELAPGKALLATKGGGAIDGLLGVMPLHPRSVAFDFERMRLYWKSYDVPARGPKPSVSALDECYTAADLRGGAMVMRPAAAAGQIGMCREPYSGANHLYR